VRVVDDIERNFDGGFGMDAGAGSIAGHRKDRANLDNFVLCESATRQNKRHRGGEKQPKQSSQFHLVVSETYPKARVRNAKKARPSLVFAFCGA
jgi:hypothetical protein